MTPLPEMPQPYEPEEPALQYNRTQFAEHYLTATLLLLDGLAHPQGEIFAYGFGEAMDAARDAGSETEKDLAHQLMRGIQRAAVGFGIRLKQWDLQ